ncbi:AMMECR1 domain-containing protein [Parachaetomium inaequale]|uniref:AMMECR1 domain-containing protein n=1 Tax=Parachaetomium inaequale TaxID=2588326 RepID=A0AAN6PLG7_9PEZI|nr:AMMECR1 domain-containing protein [Parachaetomium inaequale]
MASVEHCLYCFEALAAHLEDRKPMTLAEVHKSWAQYVRPTEADTTTASSSSSSSSSKPAKRLPALRRITEDSSSSSAASSASNSTLSLGPDTPATSTEEEDDDDSSEEEDEATLTESPLFVTWNTLSPHDSHPSLRGCIGTFEAQPLDAGLSSYALISALQDTRFPPITARELPSLEVAVTLLTDFEDAADALDWDLGTHGLRIAFHYHGRRYGATYLPDVAVEQGWTKEETLVSLMRKAGWVGRKERWGEVGLDVVRYQGKKERVGYADFKRWREWVEGGK